MGKTFTVNSQPGIQRDGTNLDANRYNDGQWVRFRRGKPKKMNGYREITANANGPSRELHVWNRQDTVQISTFSDVGIEAIQVDKNGVGANIIDRTPAGWVDTPGLVWTVDTMFDAAADSDKTLLLAHCAPSMANIDSGETGEIYYGDANGTEPLQAIGNNTAVSGGIVVLHPYLVRYGSDGLVSWSNVNEPRTWDSNQETGGDAGTARVTGDKLVKGMVVKGQGQSPSGLLWSLSSLVRMVYIGGQQVFKFDPVTGASSILSSRSVVEYDGIFYWIGIDRFLAYTGGTVVEVPNDTNQDDFFDNVNYEQRQKIFAVKVPKYGEIWWFYPRGTATECNHALIYNVREKCWYDTPLTRSSGYAPKVFRYPVMADSAQNLTALKIQLTNVNGQFIAGMHVANAGGAVGTVRKVLGNTVYVEPGNAGVFVQGDTLTASGGTGTIAQAPYNTGLHSLWVHEIGKNMVKGDFELAIPSYFETSDFGFPTGGPAQDSPMGDDIWTRIDRVEPDFALHGNMALQITGSKFAQGEKETSDSYVFDANTEVVDFREQMRIIRLKFTSNEVNGDYTMGRVLMHIEQGDVRS